MNRLLKNSKSSQKNGSPGLFSPAPSHTPSWFLSSLSFTTRTLVLALLVLLILRAKGCSLCWRSCQIKPASRDIRGFSPKEVHNDCPIEGILVHLALSLCPSNPTVCHRNELPARTGSRVCLSTRPTTHSGVRSGPGADLLCVSIWLRELAASGCVLRGTPLQEMGTVGPEGQESYSRAEGLS